MGTYSYSEYLETFGGPPEPGETYPDDPDAARNALEEYTANDAAADAAIDRAWQEDHEHDDPDLERGEEWDLGDVFHHEDGSSR